MDSETRAKLEEKGAKCNLQFPTLERDFYISACGFTDEEKDVFILRSKGKTVLQISFEMEELYKDTLCGNAYSVWKVESRIRAIKKKILNVTH